MKKLFSILLLYPMWMCAQQSSVGEPLPPKKQYVGIHVGTDYCFKTNASNSGDKVGVKGGVSYGYKFDSGFRAEVEMAYRKNSFRTKYIVGAEDNLKSKNYHSLHSWSYMANVFYDVKPLSYRDVHPYVGVGVGYCQGTEKVKFKSPLKVNEVKERDSHFAYQGIVGAKYALNDVVDIAAEYKYFCGQAHAKDHSICLALLRNF
jgi:opacity protein-like surface antigen